MGIYMSSCIECLGCGNYNSFDTSSFSAPEPLDYVIKNRPRIVCGRCGSEKIRTSDHFFCSVDLSANDSEQLWTPQNPELVWTLPDCAQRMPDIIWLDVGYNFQGSGEKKHTEQIVLFSDFSDFEKSKPCASDRPVVPFKRVRHIDDISDLYAGIPQDYRHYRFVPLYADRMPEGASIYDCHEEDYDCEIPDDWTPGEDSHLETIHYALKILSV